MKNSKTYDSGAMLSKIVRLERTGKVAILLQVLGKCAGLHRRIGELRCIEGVSDPQLGVVCQETRRVRGDGGTIGAM